MATYRYVAYSILEALNENKDDSSIRRNNIIFWVQVAANTLRAQRLAKRQIQSGEFLTHFGNIEVIQDGVRKYVSMPQQIIDLENDNGIEQVTYRLEDFDYCDSPFDQPFEKTEPAKIWSLRAIPLRAPNPTRPFMAREGNKLYLYGIENIAVNYVEMWLRTAVDQTRQLDLDASVEVAEDQIELLIQKVMPLVRFALILPNDKTNTGSDENLNSNNKTALSQAPMQTQENMQQNQQ